MDGHVVKQMLRSGYWSFLLLWLTLKVAASVEYTAPLLKGVRRTRCLTPVL